MQEIAIADNRRQLSIRSMHRFGSQPRFGDAISLALVIGGLVGVVSHEWMTVVVFALVAAVLGYLGLHLARLVLIAATSAVVIGFAIQTYGMLFQEYRINGLALGLLLAGTSVVSHFVTRRWMVERLNTGLLAGILVLIGFVAVCMRPESDTDVLARLVSMGEDNGSFLSNFATTLNRGDVELVPASGGDMSSESGILLGVFVAVVSAVFRLGQNSAGGLDPARVLLRSYDLLVIAFTVTSAILAAMSAGKRSGHIGQRIAASVGAAIALSFALGMTATGHFTALLVSLWTVLALVLILLGNAENQVMWVAAFFFLSAGQAWYPMTSIVFLAILVAAFFGLEALKRDFRERNAKRLAIVGASLLAVIGVYYSSFLAFLWNTDYVDQVVARGGSYSTIDWKLTFLILLGANLFTALDKASQRTWLLVPLISMALAAVMVTYLSRVTGNLTPQYAVFKLLYVVSAIVAPVFSGRLVGLVIHWLEDLGGVRYVVAPLVVFGIFLAYGEPMSTISRVRQVPAAPQWAEGVARSLNEEPSKAVSCIDTRPPGFSYDAYLCSRLMMGVAGVHPPRYTWTNRTSEQRDYSYVNAQIGAGNICMTDSQIIADIPAEDWRDVSLVISSTSMLSSVDDCQNKGWAGRGIVDDHDKWLLGWLTDIPWGKVSLYSYDGKSIVPSFEYLKEFDFYTSEDLKRLESMLRT